jgi:hypothetical protein
MPPTLQRVSPCLGAAGESLEVVLDGDGFQNGANVSLGDGIAVEVAVFRSEKQLSARVAIAETAPFGSRDVTVTNPDARSATVSNGFYVADRSDKDRKVFLLTMYSQMWKNIDTHILVVWQSVAAVLGALAIFSLVEKGFLPIDIASTFLLMLAAWLLAHVYDAWEWFHRNLIILTNIERQFLRTGDLKAINPFFASHRPGDRMLTHLAIQWWLGLGIAGAVLTFHFFTQVFPGFSSPWEAFKPIRCLPYAAAVAALIMIICLRRNVVRANRAVSTQSPGLTMAV